MKLEKFTIGQKFFEASIYRNGADIDNGAGDPFDTEAEAEVDGQIMAANYDPEWQKKHPGEIEHVVRACEVDSVEEDGSLGGFHTID